MVRPPEFSTITQDRSLPARDIDLTDQGHGPIHQTYGTHCTYTTSAIERGGHSGVVGESARASSLPLSELRDHYQSIKRFFYYGLPKDAPDELRLSLTAKSSSRRMFYCALPSGLHLVGQVAYRPRDRANRPDCYFGHILTWRANRGNSDILRCFDLWGAKGWRTEDGDDISYDLGSLRSLDDLLQEEPKPNFRELLRGFLELPDGKGGGNRNAWEAHLPPETRDRWRRLDPVVRRIFFRQSLQGYLEVAAGLRERLLLVAEPEVAIWIFYAVTRLLPAGSLRDRISFSTYETDADNLCTVMAAVQFYHPEKAENDLSAQRYRRDFVVNTFQRKSSDRSENLASYADFIWAEMEREEGGWDAAERIVAACQCGRPNQVPQLVRSVDLGEKAVHRILDPRTPVSRQCLDDPLLSAYVRARVCQELSLPDLGLVRRLYAASTEFAEEPDTGTLLGGIIDSPEHRTLVLQITAAETSCVGVVRHLLANVPGSDLVWYLELGDALPDYRDIALQEYVRKVTPHGIVDFLSSISVPARHKEAVQALRLEQPDYLEQIPVQVPHFFRLLKLRDDIQIEFQCRVASSLASKIQSSDAEPFLTDPDIPIQCKETVAKDHAFAAKIRDDRIAGILRDETIPAACRSSLLAHEQVLTRIPAPALLHLLTDETVPGQCKRHILDARLHDILDQDLQVFLELDEGSATQVTPEHKRKIVHRIGKSLTSQSLQAFLSNGIIREAYRVLATELRDVQDKVQPGQVIALLTALEVPPACKRKLIPSLRDKVSEADFFSFLKLNEAETQVREEDKNSVVRRILPRLTGSTAVEFLTDPIVPSGCREYALGLDEITRSIPPEEILSLVVHSSVTPTSKTRILDKLLDRLPSRDIIPFLEVAGVPEISPRHKDQIVDGRIDELGSSDADRFLANCSVDECYRERASKRPKFAASLTEPTTVVKLLTDRIPNVCKSALIEHDSFCKAIPAEQIVPLLLRRELPDDCKRAILQLLLNRLPLPDFAAFLKVPEEPATPVTRDHKEQVIRRFAGKLSGDRLESFLRDAEVPEFYRERTAGTPEFAGQVTTDRIVPLLQLADVPHSCKQVLVPRLRSKVERNGLLAFLQLDSERTQVGDHDKNLVIGRHLRDLSGGELTALLTRSDIPGDCKIHVLERRDVVDRLPKEQIVTLLGSEHLSRKCKEAVQERLDDIPPPCFRGFLRLKENDETPIRPEQKRAITLKLARTLRAGEVESFLSDSSVPDSYRSLAAEQPSLQNKITGDKVAPLLNNPGIPAGCKQRLIPALLGKVERSEFMSFLKLDESQTEVTVRDKNHVVRRIVPELAANELVEFLTDALVPRKCKETAFAINGLPARIPPNAIVNVLMSKHVPTRYKSPLLKERLGEIPPDSFRAFMRLPTNDFTQVQSRHLEYMLQRMGTRLPAYEVEPFLSDDMVPERYREKTVDLDGFEQKIPDDGILGVLSSPKIPISCQRKLALKLASRIAGLPDQDRVKFLQLPFATEPAFRHVIDNLEGTNLVPALRAESLPEACRLRILEDHLDRIPRKDFVAFLGLDEHLVSARYKMKAIQQFVPDWPSENVVDLLSRAPVPLRAAILRKVIGKIASRSLKEVIRFLKLDGIDLPDKHNVFRQHLDDNPDNVLECLANEEFEDSCSWIIRNVSELPDIAEVLCIDAISLEAKGLALCRHAGGHKLHPKCESLLSQEWPYQKVIPRGEGGLLVEMLACMEPDQVVRFFRAHVQSKDNARLGSFFIALFKAATRPQPSEQKQRIIAQEVAGVICKELNLDQSVTLFRKLEPLCSQAREHCGPTLWEAVRSVAKQVINRLGEVERSGDDAVYFKGEFQKRVVVLRKACETLELNCDEQFNAWSAILELLPQYCTNDSVNGLYERLLAGCKTLRSFVVGGDIQARQVLFPEMQKAMPDLDYQDRVEQVVRIADALGNHGRSIRKQLEVKTLTQPMPRLTNARRWPIQNLLGRLNSMLTRCGVLYLLVIVSLIITIVTAISLIRFGFFEGGNFSKPASRNAKQSPSEVAVPEQNNGNPAEYSGAVPLTQSTSEHAPPREVTDKFDKQQ